MILAVHPEPEVVARDATPDEIPASAARLAKAAVEAGFTVRVTYARGTRLGSKKVTDSIAVRMRRGQQRLVGLWVDGAYSTGLRHSPLAVLSSRELAAEVKG